MKTLHENTVVCLFAGFVTFGPSTFAQNPAPFQPMPTPPSVDTNGATFLPDHASYLSPPFGNPPIPDSPSTTTNFQGLTDNNTLFPPDTHGAVGTNFIVTMLNTQVRIQTRGGAIVTTMALSDFWTSTNIGTFTEVFDPRILYDPYNDRWIASAGVEPYSSNAGILIGVSRNRKPTNKGDARWNLRRVKADSTSTTFGDFPMLGFNKDWIDISANMFDNSSGAFTGSRHYVFNKTNLYAGSFTTPTVLTDTNTSLSFSEFPAVTYDNTLSTLYIIADISGPNGLIRMLSITGAVNSPVLNNTTNPVLIAVNSTWSDGEPNNGADFAPQFGLSVNVQNNDARMGNVIYRNRFLWFTHTVFLPTGSPTHSAVQWWQLNPNVALVEFGRIEDTTASNYYAFPSI